MENCVISNVMTRRLSERIQQQRDGFLIIVEEYSGTDTTDSDSEDDHCSPVPKRKQIKVGEDSDEPYYMRGVKLSSKPNTYSNNFVQVCPGDKNKISNIPPTCYICNALFKTRDELFFHGLVHSTFSGFYKCNICSSVLKDRNFVRLHVSKHNYLRSKCPLCPRTFCSPSYLHQHTKHEHEGVKYKCPHCNKSYTQGSNLKQHMLSHEGIYFTCYHCDKNFTHRALLVRHMGKHNKNRKRYKCKICKRSIFLLRTFKNHMQHHQGLSEYECYICAKKFSAKKSLTDHMERHESPEYKCLICKKTYVSKKLLERHVIRHSREDFKCKICGKAYVSQKILDDHLLQHEGHTYPCSKCDKTYTYLCKYLSFLSQAVSRITCFIVS